MTVPHIPGVSTHAHERMAERYGRDLTAEEWQSVVLAIIERRALLLRIEPHGREIYAVEVAGVQFRAVWMPAAAVLVSMLPPRWVAPRLAVDDRFQRKANQRRERRGGWRGLVAEEWA